MADDISEIPTVETHDTLVDPDKGIWVAQGVPVRKENIYAPQESPNKEIDIPNKPHVFEASDLKVLDRDHTEYVELHDVPVILGHALTNDGKWRFVNGQNVEDTVHAYNEWAVNNGKRPIEFVLACNSEASTQPMSIKVGNFDARENLAYAVGEPVIVSGYVDRESEKPATKLVVEARGSFFGLDQVAETAKLREQIKIDT